jgi:hypothetical protein
LLRPAEPGFAPGYWALEPVWMDMPLPLHIQRVQEPREPCARHWRMQALMLRPWIM